MKDAKSSYEKLNEKSLVIKALLLRRLSMSKKNISDKKKHKILKKFCHCKILKYL